MAASRTACSRQLRRLAIASNKRSLHMTGPATFPSPLLTSERPVAARVKGDVEAAQRQADAAIALEATSSTSVRHFNTSHALKAVGDSSTIDFAYFPDFDPDVEVAPAMRIPLLPAGLYNTTSTYAAEPEETVCSELSNQLQDRNRADRAVTGNARRNQHCCGRQYSHIPPARLLRGPRQQRH